MSSYAHTQVMCICTDSDTQLRFIVRWQIPPDVFNVLTVIFITAYFLHPSEEELGLSINTTYQVSLS